MSNGDLMEPNEFQLAKTIVEAITFVLVVWIVWK